MEYRHEELNLEVEAVAGHYLLEKEVRMPFAGREVLYVIGHGVFDTTCCGAGGCRYAIVPGFIVKWKTISDEAGRKISEVEPIKDDSTRRDLERLIKGKETVQQVNFW
jgi:hypothetical protein